MTELLLGDASYREGRFREAFAHYTARLQENPSDAFAHQGAARCLYHLGNLEGATRESEIAIQLDEGLALPHVVLGYVSSRKGDVARSEAQALRAIEIEPANSEANAHLGALLVARGALDQGAKALHKAIESDKENWYAQYWLARSESVRGNHKDALRLAWRAFRLKRSSRALVLVAVELAVVYRVLLVMGLLALTVFAFVYRSTVALLVALVLPLLMGIVALLAKRWLSAAVLIASVVALLTLYAIPFFTSK